MESNKRKRQYQLTLERIRTTVDQLVHEVGFNQMRIRDICARAEISTGNFYNYFSSKDDLLFDRYSRMNTFFRTLYAEKLELLPAVEGLKTLFYERHQFINSRVLEIQRPYLKAKIEHIERWREKEEDVFEKVLRQIIHKGVEQKEINSPYTEEEIFDFLLSIVEGIAQRQCLSGGVFLRDHNVAPLYERWIDQLQAST